MGNGSLHVVDSKMWQDVHSMNKLEHLNAHVMMVQFLHHQEEDVDEDAVVVDEVETEEETVTETKMKMTMKKKEKVEDVGVEVVEDEGIVEGEDEETNTSNEKGQLRTENPTRGLKSIILCKNVDYPI